MADNMLTKKEISESEKQQQAPETKQDFFGEKHGIMPLDLIMRNPKVTPVALLILAIAPLVITAVVLVQLWFWQ